MSAFGPEAGGTGSSRVAEWACPALANALNSLTGEQFLVSVAPQASADAPVQPLVWRQPFSIADDALFWLVAGKDLWEGVGRMILGGAGVQSVSDEDCRSTWNEIAAQTTGEIASRISKELGREVAARNGAEGSEVPGEVPNTVLEVRNGSNTWEVQIAWTTRLADTRQAAAVAADHETGSDRPVPRDAGGSRNLDLLLDVALPVSVSFGRTSLQIREVLKLNTGSIVELDRLVSEPVEVIVNNCVIARGEVVVVDGNYGVRISQLASREDRLRSGMTDGSARLGASAK